MVVASRFRASRFGWYYHKLLCANGIFQRVVNGFVTWISHLFANFGVIIQYDELPFINISVT